MAGRTPGHCAAFYPAVDIAYFDELAARVPKAPQGDGPRPVRFTYAGSMGHTYDVETIVNCARLLMESGFTGAEFCLAGYGPKFSQLQKMAQNLPNVKLLGWLNAEKLAELFVHSDVGLAAYSREATQVVTYKLFDYLVAGLPILCSLRGEMAGLLQEEDIGMTYVSEDAASLADLVKKICSRPAALKSMSRRCRAFAERTGDKRLIYADMASFVETVINNNH
jgi:glycosyltransferase involved in cell wall biosynthesis